VIFHEGQHLLLHVDVGIFLLGSSYYLLSLQSFVVHLGNHCFVGLDLLLVLFSLCLVFPLEFFLALLEKVSEITDRGLHLANLKLILIQLFIVSFGGLMLLLDILDEKL
jgi:hypothetical protein